MSSPPQRPEWLRPLYPYRTHFMDTPAGRLHYLDEGEGSTHVLCLHGNPTWSFFYRNLIARLRGSVRCLAPDHLGCGLSDKPQNGPYRLATHIDNAERLLDHLGLTRFSLVVHDWGGAIGMGVATRRPEAIERIQILNTAAFRFRKIPRRIAACRLPGIGRFATRRLNAFARAATFMTVTQPLPPEVKRGYLYPYDSYANRIAIHRFVQDIPIRPEHPSYAELTRIEEALPRLAGKPVQIHWGMRDFCFTPKALARWREIFPKARVHKLGNAGHYVLEDAPPETLDAIAGFLA